MRFPYPERISYTHAFAFSGLLCALQLIEGTSPVVASLVFFYILIATTAFNFAGGFYRASGAFVGFNAVITLVIPMVAKVLLGEPAQRNLHAPVRTLEAYVCGAIAMLIGAVVSSKFRPEKGFIADMLPNKDLRAAYRGCLIFAIFFGFLQSIASGGNGSFGSLLNQLNRFPLLCYLLGVISTVYFTRRTSLTWPLIFMMFNGASAGLYTFSKEAFLGPFFCWALACAYMRFKLSWLNMAAFAVGLFVTVTYMVPYAQVGRDSFDDGETVKEVSAYMLSHMDEVRATYKEKTAGGEKFHDYDHPVPLLDRLDMLAPDDALVEATDRLGTFGYSPVVAGLSGYIPHFLWPGKPIIFFGNVYGHEIGILGDSDGATGISFSFAADAYHEGGIFALLGVCPLIFIFTFIVFDRVIGDTRHNPVGLVLIVLVERYAPEAGIPGILNLVQAPLVAVVFIAYVAKYILPPLGSFFTRKVLERNENQKPASPSALEAPLEPQPQTT